MGENEGWNVREEALCLDRVHIFSLDQGTPGKGNSFLSKLTIKCVLGSIPK